MKLKFLYRALRKDEIEAGNIPIRKSQRPFKHYPLLGTGDSRFPFILGATEPNAIRHHQIDSNRFPTSGISTTPHIYIAQKYNKKGVIVKINFSNLKKHGIKPYLVKEYLINKEDITHPEDDEIILVWEGKKDFPKELIVDIIGS